jgi:hypothetical protein
MSTYILTFTAPSVAVQKLRGNRNEKNSQKDNQRKFLFHFRLFPGFLEPPDCKIHPHLPMDLKSATCNLYLREDKVSREGEGYPG